MQNTITEQWRDIAGYEGSYQVSSEGRVRSIDRISVTVSGQLRSYKGRVLRPGLNKAGYYQVSLCVNATDIIHRVHRLVTEAFKDKPEGKEYVNHIDGNKINNAANNLEWVTASENVQHAFDVLLRKPVVLVGERNGFAKLKEADVTKIRQMYKRGVVTHVALGKQFGVSRTTVQSILYQKIWKCV